MKVNAPALSPSELLLQRLPGLRPLSASPWRVLHLQWFAAEDEGRTEDPTEQKIRKAREEGKVAKSQDIVAAVVLLFPMVLIGFLAGSMFQTMQEMLHFYLNQAVTLDPATAGPLIWESFGGYFVRLVLPVLVIALLGAIAANLFQVGLMFTLKPITPDFTKIVPKFGQWLQKSLFSGEAVFNLLKSILKVVVIGVVAWLNIMGEIKKILDLLNQPFMVGIGVIGQLSLTIILQTAVILLAMAIPDYMYQRYRHTETLKMSPQEIKEERKQAEGDPLIKSRLRERMQEILRRNMMENVPKADVIITNPTHFAVGLQWDSNTMGAPTVIAKGMDNMALKIREIAADNRVPLVENKPLARALYASTELGDQIPEEYWEVVSRILAEVYKLNGAAQAVVG